MTAGAWAVLGAVLLALGVGLHRRSTAGRLRPARTDEAVAAPLGELGAAATFVQFSAPTCAPCRSARAVLAGLAAERPEVRHVEIDVAERLDLARRFEVTRTPTVVVLDASGRERHRLVGPIGRAHAERALTAVVPTAAA